MGGYTASTSISCRSFCMPASYISSLPNGSSSLPKVVREFFFGVKVKYTDPDLSILKSLIAFVSCSWLIANIVRIEIIIVHVEAGLEIRKGLVEKTMKRTLLRFSTRVIDRKRRRKTLTFDTIVVSKGK
jgi:hypothetical protein